MHLFPGDSVRAVQNDFEPWSLYRSTRYRDPSLEFAVMRSPRGGHNHRESIIMSGRREQLAETSRIEQGDLGV